MTIIDISIICWTLMNSMNYGRLKSFNIFYQFKVSMVHSGETLPYRKWYEKKFHQAVPGTGGEIYPYCFFLGVSVNFLNFYQVFFCNNFFLKFVKTKKYARVRMWVRAVCTLYVHTESTVCVRTIRTCVRTWYFPGEPIFLFDYKT